MQLRTSAGKLFQTATDESLKVREAETVPDTDGQRQRSHLRYHKLTLINVKMAVNMVVCVYHVMVFHDKKKLRLRVKI